MLNAQPGPDLNNPEKAFARPHAIVEARDLTRGQKEHALNCWQRVVEDRVTSSSASERDRTLLKEIDRARKAIAALFASARRARSADR